MNAKIVPFDELAKNAADDPLNILTRCGNMGGFRKVGRKQQTKYVVLYSSQELLPVAGDIIVLLDIAHIEGV